MLRVSINQLVEPIKIFAGDVNPVSRQILNPTTAVMAYE